MLKKISTHETCTNCDSFGRVMAYEDLGEKHLMTCPECGGTKTRPRSAADVIGDMLIQLNKLIDAHPRLQE